MKLNARNRGDGLDLLSKTKDAAARVVFFDPQYRDVLEKLRYGNEGARQKERAALPAMSHLTIQYFLHEIARVLKPSGYLFFWIDKYMLVEGTWRDGMPLFLRPVDLVNWGKGRMGMGYRTRRAGEHLVCLQKLPIKARATWRTSPPIPDFWLEKIEGATHAHQKPRELIKDILSATTKRGDLVIDPCAGSFVVLDVCKELGRNFLGCDLVGSHA